MIEFETYKDNLEVVDKYGIQDIPVNKSLVYTRHLSSVKKENVVEDDCVPTLAAAVIGLKNTSATLSTPSKSIYCWTDFDAQECYLNSKPTCYLILGKPGCGAYTLGEAISKKLNCIHLCPKNLILDEIEQSSKTGNCIGFNLRQKNVIKFDIILSILGIKMQSEAVKHRGYVISGLPLVSSDRKPQYLSNTLHSEESFLCVEDLIYELLVNLKKKKPKIPKSNKDSPHSSKSSDVDSEEEEVEAEEEHEPEGIAEETEEEPVVLPKFILDSCSDIIFTQKKFMTTKQAVLLQQITDIFKLSMKPDIIVHLTSPDNDLVTKRSHKYFNYTNNVYTIDPLVISYESELRWPAKCTMSDYVSQYDSHIFNPKYNCRQPIHFAEKSTQQMCNYRKYVLPFVEEKFKDFKPQHIIKLDARNPTHQMMFHLNEKLMLLSIKPVLVPEPLYLEEPPEEMEDFWNLVEEMNVIRNGAFNFNRHPSLWLNRCPVELKKRRSQIGKPKLAVTFMKHVYLLSSLDSMIAFCRNPRPFLKLKYLEPTCRIIVIGTQTSGKTMVSHCLSWLFDTPITSYENFVENEKEKKYQMYAKTILSEIIATIEEDRLLIWKNKDTERISNLNEWNNNNLNKLRSYVALFLDIIKFESKQDQTTEEEQQKPEPEELDPQLLTHYEFLRNQLSFLPFLEDIDQCMTAVDSQTLIQFAPQELVTEREKPGTPVLGDADVTKAIYNYIIRNDLQKEIEPNNEELMNELVKILLDNDNDSLQNVGTYGQFIIDGFPTDPECWSYLSEAKLLPDHTIALIENREIEQELVLYYADVAKCHKNYQERLTMTSDPLIKTKNKVKPFPDAYIFDIRNIVNESISTILNTLFDVDSDNVPDGGENKESPNADLVGTLTAAVEKFREDWDSLKLKIEENSKFYIEIELENKTDVEVLDEILLNLRKNYYLTCEVNEDDTELLEDDNENPKDVLTYNDPRNLSDTSIYCPIAFYNYGVLWEGKPDLSIKYNNKLHFFSQEHCSELFQSDVTQYQQYNKPCKSFPPLRICVIGCIGSGKTTISKLIAKELGLIHVDFAEILNIFLMPKHFKKVGREYENNFTDVSIDEEGVTEFQIDEENENLASDILGSETEMRRMVYNYFERGTPIVSVLMQKIIKKLWFEDPFVTTGFVLDGFPRLPSDVEDMITSFCVPDLVIELVGSSESMLQRLSQKYYKKWKTQLNEAKRKAKLILDNEMRDWMNFIAKHVVAKLICEDIFDVIFAPTKQPAKEFSAASVIIDAHPQGSSNVDVNLFNFYNDLTQEYPAPVDLNEWEKADEARERIDARLESIYEVDDQGLQSLKDILLEQRIKTAPIDSTKSLNKVLRIVLFTLSNLRNRCISFFEQTFVVGCDIAEMLLLEGFVFFSQYARMCPVYLFENHSTIFNPFKIMKRKEKVFPVIHRAYIYFVFGETNLSKFRTNPLKYINSDLITSFKEHPLTISVIGPPKSGKSTLAKKLAQRFGLICISRGQAVRYILNHMNWTELGIRMSDDLYKGACINSEYIMKAVQVLALDHRTATYGFVFDGFPETTTEALELTNAGLYPNTIFDIANDIEAAKKHALDEIYYSIIKVKPPYSAPFIENRYLNWSRKSYQIRNWVMQDIQNIHLIDGKGSRWQCLQNATRCIEETIKKIHYYLNNVSDKIVSPSCMGISNDIFRKRMSHFKNLCPLCLQINVLRHSDNPVDKKGVVQYKNKLYWICPNHMCSVLKYPERYLSVKNFEIPEIPATVKTVNPSLVYENGICIVTYAEHLPAQNIVRGSHKYAASFKGKTYLFCSLKCQDTFLAKPHMFCAITVFKVAKMFPALSLKNLPNLGYLEQTIGNIITEACCAVNVLRPKYPGLDIRVSALLYIALYLKTHNSLTVKSVLAIFEKVLQVYEARCKLVLDIGLRLRSMDNPFVKYPKCCSKIRYLDSGTVTKVSSITNNSISAHTVVSEFQK